MIPVGITPSGCWVPMPSDPQTYDLTDGGGYVVPEGPVRVGFMPGSSLLTQFEVDEAGMPLPGSLAVRGEVDVVFPLLHGPFGEDGTVQGLLELSKVRYVGCGVASSAVCQDKHLTKTVLAGAGIDVGRWVTLTKSEWENDSEGTLLKAQELGFPMFVKPCRAGSSLGVSRVTSPEELTEAIEEAQEHDPRVIIEAAVSGREVECGVLVTADGELHTSAIGEIKVLEEEFYDYETKYFDADAVALQCPADLPGAVVERIKETAARAFLALEGEGISRVDFFYDAATDRLVLNEVNTMPGFTPFSMYPVMFQQEGLSYGELVGALLEEAESRTTGLR